MPELTPEFLLYGFIWYVAFLFSTTCHEAAHALVAKRGGDETASEGGQVSLNPFPHIRRELFGMVIVPLLSYFINQSMIGWASAPFDPAWERRYPRRAGWMALAGPAANFSLMLLAVIALRLGLYAGWFGRDAVSGRPACPRLARDMTASVMVPAAPTIQACMPALAGTRCRAASATSAKPRGTKA